MTARDTASAPDRALPALPHWDTVPDDLTAAIRQLKPALRARIEASGRSVEEVFAVVERRVAARVAEIRAEKERGDCVWPVIEYADIANGTVSAEQLDRLKKRGCLVVRGHFDRDQALAWDAGIVDYVEKNAFFEQYTGPGDDFFGSVGSKPEIYPIYWSAAQMEARQSDRMAHVQAFLNSLWKHESEGVRWFDPDRDALYPDRIRRRPPGADSAGLGTHCDPGTLDLSVPVPEAMAYLMLRPLLPDVPEDDMCGVTTNQVFPASEKWHPLLMEALTGIPDVRAGDSVWWHCDMIHSVAPVTAQQGWGNVMYIPAAPWCPRNERYAAEVREAFRTGSSPADFPEEHYERTWTDRFTPDRLNARARSALSLP